MDQLPLIIERASSLKPQVKPQRGLPSLNLTVAEPRLSQREAITPQAHTHAIQNPLKCISSLRKRLKVTIENFEFTLSEPF
jgi:hypothetical protein